MEAALSMERFARYVAWAAGDRQRAAELYALNTRLSESLYTPLQMLEVALRNRIHTVMTDARHDTWFHDAGTLHGEWQATQIAKVIQDIETDGKTPTPGAIVAGLTFGFWTAMFGKDYETLWQTTLHRIGQKPGGKGLGRKDFSAPLSGIRQLRNRVAHHEPILKWDLPRQHEKMVEITGWLSPAAADWCRTHSRFLAVYPAEPLNLSL